MWLNFYCGLSLCLKFHVLYFLISVVTLNEELKCKIILLIYGKYVTSRMHCKYPPTLPEITQSVCYLLSRSFNCPTQNNPFR